MSNKNLGSYSFGTFDDNDLELSRLMRQAQIAWKLEMPFLLKHGAKADHNFVDFACGPGVVTNLIRQDVVTEGNVIGVELNDELIQVASDLHETPKSPKFLQGDVYDPSCLDDGYFDFAYARFLFQHLRDPSRALKAVHEKLVPGGRLAILDVDDGLFTFQPEIHGLNEFLEAANSAQSSLGGNRTIGRKLPQLLWQNGYKDIQVDVIPISTDDLGGKDFVDITTKFKLTLLDPIEQTKATEVIDCMVSAVEQENCFGLTYVFMVSGRK